MTRQQSEVLVHGTKTKGEETERKKKKERRKQRSAPVKQIHALHKQHDGNHPSQRKESGGGAE